MDRYVTDIKNGCYQNPVLPMDFSDPDAIRVGRLTAMPSPPMPAAPGPRRCATMRAGSMHSFPCRTRAFFTPKPPTPPAPGVRCTA